MSRESLPRTGRRAKFHELDHDFIQLQEPTINTKICIKRTARPGSLLNTVNEAPAACSRCGSKTPIDDFAPTQAELGANHQYIMKIFCTRLENYRSRGAANSCMGSASFL